MPAKDVRVINPVKPGVLSWLGVLSFSTIISGWGIYVFRSAGILGFFGKGGLIFIGLTAASVGGIRLID